MTSEIEQIIDAYHTTTLRMMAEEAGIGARTKSKKITKSVLADVLPGWYFSQERVQASYAKLQPLERDVLNRLLLRGGRTATRILRRETQRADLTTAPPEPEKDRFGHARYRGGVAYAYNDYNGTPHDASSAVFEDVIARLTYHGLVFSQTQKQYGGGTNYKMQFHPAETLFVPEVVRRWLPAPEPLPMGVTDWEPARRQSADPMPYLRDLYLYWDFVRRNGVELIRGGFVGKRMLKTINDLLLTPDPRLDDVRHEQETTVLYPLRNMLEALALVRVVNNKLAAAGKDALEIPAFWSGALAEQIGACLRQWPQLQRDADFHAEAEKYGPRYEAGYRALLNKLPNVPTDLWVEPADLLDELQNDDMNFLFSQHEDVETSRYDHYSGYIGGSYYYGNKTEILQDLVRLEALFVRRGIEHFLLPLGLVELGYAAEDNETWQAFRWTPLGQTVLNKAQSPTPDAHQGTIVVQPNFHVLAMGPVQLNLLAQLDLFAERERADVGAFEYRLTRESVYAAQQLGLDAATIRQTLVQMGGSELPQNVRRTLEEWSAHHERIVFHTRVDLLQAADDALLKKLLETAPSSAHLARPLAPTDAPTVALIKERGKKKLVAALLEAEILPAISSANPDAADASVTIDEAGTIQPIHAVPSLHLRGRLDRVADESNGGWRLTEKSVQRAGGSQKKVTALLDELGKLQRGALPAKLVDQLKAWGGYYGAARAETLTLIEFQNQSILDELRAHPALKDHLTPFAREGRALAIVENGKLAEVKKVLSDFGVTVKKGIG